MGSTGNWRTRGSYWPWLALVATALLVRVAGAQQEETNLTPRSVVRAFLETARSGHYEKAAELAFPHPGNGPGFVDPALTARELKAVFDAYIPVDLSKIPDTPDAHSNEHPAADMLEIGRIPSSNDHPGSIRVIRTPQGWVFSPSTLNLTPLWYSELPDRWIRERFPEPLQRAGPRGLLWWQWLAMPLLILLAFLLAQLIRLVVRLIIHLVARRVPRVFDNRFLRKLTGPLTLLVTVLVTGELVGLIILTIPAQDFIQSVVAALVLASLFWAALRIVDFGIESLREASFAKDRPERLALLPLFSKAAKVTIAVVAIIEVLQRLGYPVASLIAGLGIGGLAVALAAQKTVENLFGSVILGVDQPFRPGDTVKIDDLTGKVENVGLRSTRIRTDSRTVVTIPNGRLSDMRIESYAPRDRISLSFKIGLVYSTRAEQLRRIVDDIRSYLAGLPELYPDSASVFFTTLGGSSLDVEVNASINTTDYTRFQILRQEILFKVMEIVERNGSAFALPTRTVQLLQASANMPRP